MMMGWCYLRGSRRSTSSSCRSRPKEETRARVLEAAEKLAAELRALMYFGAPLEVEVDQRDLGGGVKNWEWIKKGVPLRVELGPRDLESGTVAVSRRDQPVKTKEFLPIPELVKRAVELLDSIQTESSRARETVSRRAYARDRFEGRVLRFLHAEELFQAGDSRWICFGALEWLTRGRRENQERSESHDPLSFRSMIRRTGLNPGSCIFSGEPSPRRVVWAKAY